jgi:hypothetical protein
MTRVFKKTKQNKNERNFDEPKSQAERADRSTHLRNEMFFIVKKIIDCRQRNQGMRGIRWVIATE